MHMDKMELPEWAQKLKHNYEADPVRWMWGGMTALVIVLIVGLVGYMVKNQREKASAEFSAGLLALQQSNYAGAAQSFQKIRSSYRWSGFRDRALMMNGAALFGLSRYAEAEAAYREFAESSPGDELAPEAWMNVGACREMVGDTVGALRIYRDALSRKPDFFGAKALEVRIARLALATGDLETPVGIYDRLEKDSEGLWREIARGNRRMVNLSQARVPAPSDSPGQASLGQAGSGQSR